MKEFIEFEGHKGKKFAVRNGYTVWARELLYPNEDEITQIHVDDGSNTGEDFTTPEPIDQVIAKLEAAEHIEMRIAERFTKEEYEIIDSLVRVGYNGKEDVYVSELDFMNILNKLQDAIGESEKE